MMVFAPPIHGKIYSFRLPVAFQKVNRVDILFLKGKYSIFKSERVDYDLKYCMETRFSKIRTSGRNVVWLSPQCLNIRHLIRVNFIGTYPKD
jgi:hypothetical protein